MSSILENAKDLGQGVYTQAEIDSQLLNKADKATTYTKTEVDSEVATAESNAIQANRGFKNYIINGNFDVWQRGTSFSAIEYTADRWKMIWNGAGTTRSLTKQNSTLGMWGEFSIYANIQNTVAPTGQTYNLLAQRVEGVGQLSGKKVTVSLYAKSSSLSQISVGFSQVFGTGGSAQVDVTPSPQQLLTNTWSKYSFTFDIPSILGKTVGTDHYLQLNINLPLNSTFNVDIAQVQLEEGSVATPFEHRPYGLELSLCQRYYEIVGETGVYLGHTLYTLGEGYSVLYGSYAVPKRIAPTIGDIDLQYFNAGWLTSNLATTRESGRWSVRPANITTNCIVRGSFSASSEL